MKILFVWDGDYPWDIRVDKICSSLVKSGHSLHIVCRNLARKPISDMFNGAHIYRLPLLPKWTWQLNSAISFPAFFSPFWLWHMHRIGKEQKCELVIVRDLPMALGAIWVAKRLGVPCILDMAECYPEMLRCTWKFEGLSLRNYFLRNPKLADWVERRVMQSIDEVWVMIEESRDRLIRMGVDGNKLKIISNTPIVSRFQEVESAEEKHKNQSFKLVYVGLLNSSRGLDTTIKAVSKYVKRNPNFEFTVVGKGKAEKQLKQLVNELGVGKWIKFLGWVDNVKVPLLISRSDVGIVPHHKCSHWDNTIPNKLFDYMAANKPVIVSNVQPMARIVKKTECGLVYKDYDIDSLVSILEQLNNVKLRERLGGNGQSAVHSRFNWETEEKILNASINSFAVLNETRM